MWRTKWTGAYPNLCSGMWHLYHEDVEVDNPFYDQPANTRNVYFNWYFDSNWEEIWEEYEDGLDMDEWIDDFQDWLSSIAPEEEWEEIYLAFKANDWRINSCGGCV